MDEREKHLRDLAEVSRAKPHFQMLTWSSAEWAMDEIDRLREERTAEFQRIKSDLEMWAIRKVG